MKAPDAIASYLEVLKEKVGVCSFQYIKGIEQALHKSGEINAFVAAESGEQGRLNRIITALNFD